MSCILQEKRTTPTDTAARDLAESIFDDLGKAYREQLPKTALLNWLTNELRKTHKDPSASMVYNILFKARVRVKPPTLSPPAPTSPPPSTPSATVTTTAATSEPPVPEQIEGSPRVPSPSQPVEVSDRRGPPPEKVQMPLERAQSSAPPTGRGAGQDNGILEVFSVEIRDLGNGDGRSIDCIT